MFLLSTAQRLNPLRHVTQLSNSAFSKHPHQLILQTMLVILISATTLNQVLFVAVCHVVIILQKDGGAVYGHGNHK